jgi:hypothetical protein
VSRGLPRIVGAGVFDRPKRRRRETAGIGSKKLEKSDENHKKAHKFSNRRTNIVGMTVNTFGVVVTGARMLRLLSHMEK